MLEVRQTTNMSDLSDVSIASECNKPEEDPVICFATSKLNRRNRVDIKISDYSRLEEWGIIKTNIIEEINQ